MTEMAPIPFVLGMFTVSGSPAFPALVLDDEAAISIDAVAPLAARLGSALTGTDSVFGLLQNWDHNFPALCATVAALDDAVAGKYFRSAFTASDFLTATAPLPAARQVLCELTGKSASGPSRFTSKLASTVVGPRAKILLPKRAGRVVAEAKIGVVVSRPAYQMSTDEAEQAIAGYMTVTDVSLLDKGEGEGDPAWLSAKSQPSFLPTGPYFVPRAFAGDADRLEMNISINGERSLASSLSARSESLATTLSRLSQDIQFFPGDIICCGVNGHALADLPALGDGDIIETAVQGLGQQTCNAMRTSDDPGR